MEGLLIFRTDSYLPGLYDQIFGAIFMNTQTLVTLTHIGYFLSAITLLLAINECRTPSKAGALVTQSFCLFCFTLLCFLLLDPWDEMFVNLRHSIHLAEEGVFSFNRLEKIEGTVDFLPFLFFGLLAKFDLPVVELCLIQGWLGGIACIFAIRSFVGYHLPHLPQAKTITVFVLSFFPPLLLNSSHGFTTTLLTSMILWGSYFLFCTTKMRIALLIFAILPWVRPESIAAVWLLLVGRLWKDRTSFRSLLQMGLIASVPLILLSIFRWQYFGSPIPTPIVFKSTFGNLGFLKLGMENFTRDLQQTYVMGLLGIGLACYFNLQRKKTVNHPVLITPVAFCIFLFTLPYYFSGGDWFPIYWGRYMLPLALSALCFCLVLVFLSASQNQKTKAILLALGMVILWTTTPKYSSLEWIADKLQRQQKRETYQVHRLSQVGMHLGRTSNPVDRIAAPEVAASMFYARREGVDLLGVANPQLAKNPLSKTPHLINRRVRKNPLVTKPEFLIPIGFFPQHLSPLYLSKELEAIQERNRNDNQFFFGGIKALNHQGYTPILIKYKNLAMVYFTSNSTKHHHINKLKQLGFKRGQSTFGTKKRQGKS